MWKTIEKLLKMKKDYLLMTIDKDTACIIVN